MSRTRAVTRQELRSLVKRLDEQTRLAVMISADTGLRVSDILNLEAGKLAREMSVTEQKTGKTRKVTLSTETYNYAKRIAKYSGKYLINLDRSTIYRHIKTAASDMGLAHVSMHSIRKYYARRYCRAHGLAQTQREMAHDYLSTTLLYVVDPDELEE